MEYDSSRPVNVDDFKFTNYRNAEAPVYAGMSVKDGYETYRGVAENVARETEKAFERSLHQSAFTPAEDIGFRFRDINRHSSVRDTLFNNAGAEQGYKDCANAISARQNYLRELAKEYTVYDSSTRSWSFAPEREKVDTTSVELDQPGEVEKSL